MESGDDFLGSKDFDSVDDDLYSGDLAEDDEYYYGDDCVGDADVVEPDLEADGDTDGMYLHNYVVLNEADVQKRLEGDVARVLQVLSACFLSRFEAIVLLRQFNWSVSKLHEEWFADEEKVRKSVGLLENRDLLEHGFACGICFDSFPSDEISSTAYCVHQFCKLCWLTYIGTSVEDGPGCLNLRCPDPSCDAAVDQDMVNRMASGEDKQKYSRYLLRSYIEDNRNTKWCPAPGCEYAINFDFTGGGGINFDVTCLCSYHFCWNCTEEAHRPLDCGTVAKWILKNSTESENTNWILDNSKPCPKCKRPIEKNQGCMHMTCRQPCNFQFCWICLGSWDEHEKTNGNFYNCNIYTALKKGANHEAETRREMAKNSLVRYTHYYERWASNHSSRQKAIEDLNRVQTVDLEILGYTKGTSQSQLKFIVEAWQQIIECRAILKWTYAYGYYIPEHEDAKRNLFEYLQGQAEVGLERLHRCAEKEIQPFLNDKGPSKEFDDFRSKLAGLTLVTKNYFENLLRALENGLEDVESPHTGGL